MRVAVTSDVAPRERRVALVPDTCRALVDAGHDVHVERGAGVAAGYPDAAFADAGARLGDRADVVGEHGVVVQVRGPGTHDVDDPLAALLTADHTLITNLDPLWQAANAEALARTGAAALALELVPRITRAQSMDVLSSQATVAGYEAVLLAASQAPRLFPMLMTAAGTVPPTRVFVLGAGVAGLQAIATAKRLGAVVEAYDVRPAAVEQIQSVGGKAIELDMSTADSEDSGGYAKEQSEDQNARQQRLLAPYIAESDVVITTAAIPGRPSPLLVTEDMVAGMRPGSVVIDLAAERGGNCALTVADEERDHDGVLICGPTDLPSRSARTSSQMLSTNIATLLAHLTSEDGALLVDADDEITAAMLVAEGGAVVHERVLTELGVDPVGEEEE